jgi:Ca2+-binding EF-hand superfamily protein
MGLCCSNRSGVTFHTEFIIEYNRFATLFARLRLSQLEVRKLYAFFREIDKDNSGFITADEFRAKIKLRDTPFLQRVFSLFDDSGDGKIDFGEFVSILFQYCTFSNHGIICLAFDLYDADGSGLLEVSEIAELVRQVYDTPGAVSNDKVDAALVAMSGGKAIKGDVSISKDRFAMFAVEHPAVLEPALDLQTEVSANPGDVCGLETSQWNVAAAPAGDGDPVLGVYHCEEEWDEGHGPGERFPSSAASRPRKVLLSNVSAPLPGGDKHQEEERTLGAHCQGP